MKYNLRTMLRAYPVDILSKLVLMPAAKEVHNAEKEWQVGKTYEEKANRQVDIEITINGFSVDPRSFFDDFLRAYEGYVKDDAEKLVEEKFKEMFGDRLDEFRNTIDQLENKLKKDMGIPERED